MYIFFSKCKKLNRQFWEVPNKISVAWGWKKNMNKQIKKKVIHCFKMMILCCFIFNLEWSVYITSWQVTNAVLVLSYACSTSAHMYPSTIFFSLCLLQTCLHVYIYEPTVTPTPPHILTSSWKFHSRHMSIVKVNVSNSKLPSKVSNMPA